MNEFAKTINEPFIEPSIGSYFLVQNEGKLIQAFLKFYYLFGFFLIAQVSKTVAYHADDWPDDLTDRGNMKLNNVIASIRTIFLDDQDFYCLKF